VSTSYHLNKEKETEFSIFFSVRTYEVREIHGKNKTLIQRLHLRQISCIQVSAHKFLDWRLFYCIRTIHSRSLSRIAATEILG